MPTPDLSALIRWPNVPACYGWLSLDRRGRWRLQGEPVTHQGFVEFINRQYGCDEAGNWFLQNGPQRVFVALEYTPWVLHFNGAGALLTHTGTSVSEITKVLLDEDGALLFEFELGVGVLDDRDLAAGLNELCAADGQQASDEQLLAALDSACETLRWRSLPVNAIRREDVPAYFSYIPDPQA